MADKFQPPKKRAKLGKNLEVDRKKDQNEEKMSLIVLNNTFEGFKCMIQNVIARKDNDYLNLELQFDSTLDTLEQYKQNSENARKKIAALEEELNEALVKNEEKDKEIKKAEEKLINFGDEMQELHLELQTKFESSEKRLSEKNVELKKFELLLRKHSMDFDYLHQKNQQLLKENRMLTKKLEEKDVEVDHLNEKLSKSKNEEKKNYFVLNNEDNNDLAVCLLDKEDELKNLQLVYRDSLNQIEQKKHKMIELEEQLLQNNRNIKRLKTRDEKMFQKLKEKDEATTKLKAEFKKHFEELTRRLSMMHRQQSPVFSPMVNQILRSLKPVEQFDVRNHIKNQNISSDHIN